MHLVDAFIQSDLKCTQAIDFLSVCVPWESNPQPLRGSNHWATVTLGKIKYFPHKENKAVTSWP